ncbi:GAF domain-containing protein [Xylophilus rhododendri]|uniref:histidine kinase n=1 Tax=Xylophilus rhododendri TaxID=2697032 RepID=A0A857IYU0_9BURK|nr:ATP-binding protein [Xylophilus rhododendri]QHI96744.1 GAF domain-containing protein [Xylophilus rhododendri]
MPLGSIHQDKRAQQLRKLTEISRALTYAVSLGEVLDLTVRRAAELLESQRSILMLTGDDGVLSVRASHGLDTAKLGSFHEPLHETLITRLEALLLAGPDEHFLGVPLVAGGDVTGLLAVAKPSGLEDQEDDEWLLSALADQAAVALEKSRLDETAEFRERLIGIVSHDLRNPVAVIMMAAAVLSRWEQMEPAAINKLISRIQNSGKRVTDMIRDLLDFTQARLGSGIPIGRKRTELHSLVRQVVEEMEIAHPERSFSLQHLGNGRGEWDADRLAQVIGNLLSNAVAYSPPDSVVRLTTDGTSEGFVTLVIENMGKAIPGELLPHLFEPMRRASADLTNMHRSVGLGLYIVKHIVDAHGGVVTVSSSDAMGTAVRVQLPRNV